MKKGLLIFSLFALSVSWGQRNMDLMTMILSPVDNEEVVVNQTANFSIEMMNSGSESLLATDSLYIYVTVDGMPLTFQPDNLDHTSRSGISIPANGNYGFAFPMVFTSGFEGTHDICFNIIPVNGNDAITETAPADNTDCVTIVVVSNNAGLEDLETDGGMVYPNPAKTTFYVNELTDDGKAELESTDGKTVEELRLIDGGFDISHLPNGTYFVRYIAKSGKKTVRLIVAH